MRGAVPASCIAVTWAEYEPVDVIPGVYEFRKRELNVPEPTVLTRICQTLRRLWPFVVGQFGGLDDRA